MISIVLRWKRPSSVTDDEISLKVSKSKKVGVEVEILVKAGRQFIMRDSAIHCIYTRKEVAREGHVGGLSRPIATQLHAFTPFWASHNPSLYISSRKL